MLSHACLGDINASKDGSSLADAWQALRQQLRRQVVEVQVDVVLHRHMFRKRNRGLGRIRFIRCITRARAA